MNTTFQRTTQAYRPGARTLPGTFYTSSDTLAAESERIFSRQWNCAGRSSSIPHPGDFMVRSIANESILIVRDRQHGLRAYFNVCRHRGTRICAGSSGHFSESIQCPYHAWTYGIDGRLIGAPHMQGVPGFDKADYPLHGAAVAECEGFVFVNIDDDPPAFREAFAPMADRLARFSLSALKVARRVAYDVHANWKLVFQNYSECLHCPIIHPELAAVLPYQSGANDLIEGSFLGGYMEILPPNQSATISGRSCGRAINPATAGAERHRAYYYTLMPNLLLSIHPDYVNYYLVTPMAPDRTLVESEWMFHPDNDGDPGFNPEDAIRFWDVTNRQDWDIVARSQLGIASRRYAPGPYSPRESIPAAWDREYLRLMGRPGEGGGG